MVQRSKLAGCVFSTSVEVFPQQANCHFHSYRLLHVRGGVSDVLIARFQMLIVFSTSVEVFPK